MKRKTTPLGAPLDTPDEALDILALITPEDIEAARADLARHATPRGKALLETARVEPQEEPPPA